MKTIFIAMEERAMKRTSIGVPVAASFNREKLIKHIEKLNDDSKLKMDFTFYYLEHRDVIFIGEENE